MFNALVTIMTLIAVAFVVVWWRYPEVRDWMELPKYRLVRRGRGQTFH